MHRTPLTFLLFALGFAFAHQVAACVPVPSHEILVERTRENSDFVMAYVVSRWLKCGWPKTKEVVALAPSLWREADSKHHGDDDGELALLLGMRPASVVELAMKAYTDMESPELQALRLRDDEKDAAIDRFDRALPDFAEALLKANTDPEVRAFAQMQLIGRDARLGHVEAARSRLDRLQSDPEVIKAVAKEDAVFSTPEIVDLRRAVDGLPVSQSDSPEPGSSWILDRSRRRRGCGLGAIPLYTPEAIRADVLASRNDFDGAVAQLLDIHWHSQIEGTDQQDIDDLVAVLRKRYPGPALAQAWSDGEASIRVDGANGLTLFGNVLPLPEKVRENSTGEGNEAAYVERPLTRAEALELLHATPLYKATNTAPES